jgi:putative membrane protein insertion efficiency factor
MGSSAHTHIDQPSLPRRIVSSPIRFWSKWISPSLAPRCRYEPSCSRYATQAVEELGILRGLTLAVWRVLRCNPLSKGGVDRVSDRTLFSAQPNHHH